MGWKRLSPLPPEKLPACTHDGDGNINFSGGGVARPPQAGRPPLPQTFVKGLLRQYGDNVVEPQFVAQMTQAGWGCISFFNTTAKKFQNKKL